MLAQPKRTHLNRALSKLGLCSRGVADGWIAAGRVSVNGERAVSPEQWVELGNDRIDVAGLPAIEVAGHPATEVAGHPATVAGLPPAGAAGPQADPGTYSSPSAPQRPRVYLALHKPAGYVTTRSDELGRKTVYDLLPDATAGWLFPVGRLDRDSEGLLLMTDDGEWANLLTDPEFHVEKIYRVKLDGRPGPEDLERFRAGIELDGTLTLPAGVEAEGGGWHKVVLTEGRNRQIRRMFHALGYKVKRLVRVAIGPLELGDLAAGGARPLRPEMVEALRRAAREKGGRR